MKIDRNLKVFSYLAIIVTVIFWGYSFVSTKILLDVLPPVTIAFFRQIIAAATLFTLLFIKRMFVRMPIRDVLLLFAASFFGIVLYFVFENTGLKFTTASNGSIIVAAVPIFTLITEFLFYKFKITSRVILCVFMSVIGVFLVIFEKGVNFSSGYTKGNLLMVGAMVAWVIYTIICKTLTEKYSGIIITAYQMAAASILFIPFVIPEIKSWQPIAGYELANLLYLALFCSALAYYLFNFAVRGLGATVSSMFLNLIPVVSIIGGVLVLNESISVIQIGGMLLIMLSLVFIKGKEKHKN